MAVAPDQRPQGRRLVAAGPSGGAAVSVRDTLEQPWFDEVIPWPKRIPSLSDVIAAILNATRNLKHWTIIATFYATGIRMGEPIRPQVGDIDGEQMVIHIRQGKGRIPRYIVLSPALLERLRTYCRRYKMIAIPGA